jgi:ABC-type glycerol-3-phosphate transport system substrate-binding protein
MPRTSQWLVLGIGVVFLVTACGAGEISPAPGAATEPSAPAASAAPASEAPSSEAAPATLPDITGDPNLSAHLVVWGWESAVTTLKEVEADFAAMYPNIEIEFVIADPASTYQNLQLAVSAGSGGPDISVIEDSHLAQFVSLGALADISDEVAPYLPFMNAYKWQAATLDGRYYAMPWDSGPVAVFYRRDVFEAAGVDPASIATWADFHEAAQTIKEQAGVPIWQQSKARNSARLFETLIWQRGLGYVDETGNVILDKDPRILETLQYLGSFWEEDLAADNEDWTDPWYTAFADGDAATIVEAAWMGAFFKGWIAPDADGKWGVFKLPVWQTGDAQASNDGGSALAILEESSQKEASWAFVQFHLGRPESQLAMYEAWDFFPALEPTYADDLFQEPDPYFGGDRVRALFSETVSEIPSAGMYTSDYQEMNGLLAPEIQKFALGDQTAEQALAAAAQLIRDQTGRQ